MSCKNCNCERIAELEKRFEEIEDHCMSLEEARKVDLMICREVESLRCSIRDLGDIVSKATGGRFDP